MDLLLNVITNAIKADPTLDLDQWANQYFLTARGSAIPGLIDTSLTPYIKQILKDLSWTSPIRQVDFIKGTQVGATTIVDIVLQNCVHSNPCPILTIFGSEAMAKEHVSTRVEPSFEQNPNLIGLVRDSMDKKGKNNKLLKLFDGGSLRFAGGKSGKSYRSYSAGIVMIDDVDALDQNIGSTVKSVGEGSPLKLAKSRTDARQGKYKLYFSGTPTDEQTSLIYKSYLDGDCRQFLVPCPSCDHKQFLDFFKLKFEKTSDYKLSSEVQLECESCKELIPETRKSEMLEGGEWRKTKNSVSSDRVSYMLPSTYSTLGITWKELAVEFLHATRRSRVGDFSDMVHFYNTRLALPWREKSTSKINYSELKTRQEPFYQNNQTTIPREAIILSVGVDVQNNRLEATLIGFSVNNERFVFEHKIIGGDPWVAYTGNYSGCWEQLEGFLDKTYLNEFGFMQGVTCVSIDNGFCTQNAGKFVETMTEKNKSYRLFSVKGHGSLKRFVNNPTKNKYGSLEYPLGVDFGKFQTFNQLKIKEKGNGFIHFSNHPSISEQYFRGLTIERLTEPTATKKMKWTVPDHAYNEPTDTMNYALAGEQILNPDYDIFLEWNINGGNFISNNQNKKGKRVLSKGI